MKYPTTGRDQLQVLFLRRAARLGRLYRRYLELDLPSDRADLLAWALYSTLGDCARLGIGSQARTVFTQGTYDAGQLAQPLGYSQVLPQTPQEQRLDKPRGEGW